MKKNVFKAVCSLMLTALLFMGCQKITEELKPVEDLQDQQHAKSNDGDKSKCQLSRILWSDGLQFDFTYNRKGLADMWLVTYGPGDYQEHQIKYNNNNRIKSTRVTDPIYLPGDAVNYTFYDDGNFTTRALGYLESGEIWGDIFYTYNNKGQMTREDDIVRDYHTRFYYNNMGFNTKVDFYIGTDLLYRYTYEFKIPNKNPYLAVNGVEFGFPFYTFPLFDKRWESRGTGIYYEEGTPYIFYDLDPAQTTMQTGTHNYMTYSSYYDMATETAGNVTCTYQNCGGDNDDDDFNKTTTPSSAKTAGPLSIRNKLNQILSRPSKNMKQELKDFKRQYFSQLKPMTSK